MKLLLLAAHASRPALKAVSTVLLGAITSNDEVPLRYKQASRTFEIVVRITEEESDLHSIFEVVIRRVYALDPTYAPDLIIDGGANIGLFSLQAAATYPAARIIACEPLPSNITQLERHLSRNHVAADLRPVCLGGSRRTIPFYCRGANSSSFDSTKAYESVIHIDVLSLNDILGTSAAKRILIKLDIEGMELETLASYVPNEQREVIVLGELHSHRKNFSTLEHLFEANGWSFKVGDLSGEDTIFEAHSPAALQSLPPAAQASKPYS